MSHGLSSMTPRLRPIRARFWPLSPRTGERHERAPYSDRMQHSRLLDCLASDLDRLRCLVRSSLAAAGPTCPGWTVADLTRHLGEVYLHKTIAMRDGAEPEAWPPKEL